MPTDIDLLDLLSRSSTAVTTVISEVQPQQWREPTPCTDWTVAQVVGHLIGMNRVFTAMVTEQPPPRRDPGGVPNGDLPSAYQESAAALHGAFSQAGVLDRTFHGPLGSATGAERLQIRLYDLLAHGWDIARATGRPVQIPDDAAEQALSFARNQLLDDARPGRFAPAQTTSNEARAIEQLAAFLGRRPDWTP